MDTNDEKLFVQGGGLSNCWLCNRGPKHLGHGIAGKPCEKCIGRGVWTAKNSIPATARIRRCLKGQKVGLFVPDLVAFDSVVVALRVKANSGGTSLARRSRRRWGPVSPFAEKGATYRPTSDCSRPSQRFPGRGHSPEWTREFAVNGPCLSIRFSSRVL